MPFAVVEEETSSTSERINDQIQITVAIHIRERRARRALAGAADSSFTRDIDELPIAEVSIKRIGMFERAKVEVDRPIAVDVPRRDPGAVQKDLIGQSTLIGE